jgi:Holliday junction resolvase
MHVTNANKAKGDSFERSITNYLVARGIDAVRTRAGYERDYGDIHIRRAATSVWPSAILQAKNHRTWKLAEWMRALPAQVAEAKALAGALVVKRPGISAPGAQYVVVELDDYLALLDLAGLTEQSPGVVA